MNYQNNYPVQQNQQKKVYTMEENVASIMFAIKALVGQMEELNKTLREIPPR